MSFYGDVYETIIDGCSGIAAAGSDVKIFIGTCSKGTVGTIYIFGASGDFEGKLGKGNLPDRIKDFFLKAPNDAVIIAIPATADVAGTTGAVKLTGSGKATYTLTGTPSCDADILIKIITGGKLNTVTMKYSIDGGDNWSDEETIPTSGIVSLGETGITITFVSAATESESFVAGDIYSFSIVSATAGLTNIMAAINVGLDKYTPRFIYIAQGCNNTVRAALGAKADELFEAHRPTYFIGEAVYDSTETIDAYVTRLVTEKASYSHPYVVICASYGEITQTDGYVPQRNHGGLLAGYIAKARVNQSIGEVASFPVTVAELPSGWTSAHSKLLDDAGYCTLRLYAGKSSYYWSNGRTLADSTSDYQFIEVLETVFKAVRLARAAALDDLQSGVEDNLDLAKIKQDIKDSLKVMIKAIPHELASDTDVILPDNQDITNNGLAYELDLKGIPILRKIHLYFKFSYTDPFSS
jgi:hypothetical protein